MLFFGGLEAVEADAGFAWDAAVGCGVGVFGAVISSAQAFRWRAVGRCTSQHDTSQETRPVRGRLQVETLQT